MTTYNYEYFRKKKSFKNYLDSISHYIEVINKYLLKGDYDTVREYAGYAESTIKRERKTMEEIPELKSPEIEKFLEESLNEAKAALRRCPNKILILILIHLGLTDTTKKRVIKRRRLVGIMRIAETISVIEKSVLKKVGLSIKQNATII